MVIRSALGALGAIAIIGGLAAALPEHRKPLQTAAMPDVPFGGLTKPEFKPAQQIETVKLAGSVDAAKLISLATYTPAPQTPLVRAETSGATQDGSVMSGSSASEPAAQAPRIVPLSRPPAVTARADPQPAAVPMPPDGGGKAASTLININTASAAALNGLPGAGRIGRSIVRRRPYASLDDLIRKRVLRAGTLQRIRPLITVD